MILVDFTLSGQSPALRPMIRRNYKFACLFRTKVLFAFWNLVLHLTDSILHIAVLTEKRTYVR